MCNETWASFLCEAGTHAVEAPKPLGMDVEAEVVDRFSAMSDNAFYPSERSGSRVAEHEQQHTTSDGSHLNWVRMTNMI